VLEWQILCQAVFGKTESSSLVLEALLKVTEYLAAHMKSVRVFALHPAENRRTASTKGPELRPKLLCYMAATLKSTP